MDLGTLNFSGLNIFFGLIIKYLVYTNNEFFLSLSQCFMTDSILQSQTPICMKYQYFKTREEQKISKIHTVICVKL